MALPSGLESSSRCEPIAKRQSPAYGRGMRSLLLALASATLAGSGLAQAPVQNSYLKSFAPDIGDRFGTCVAIADDILVVGAPFEDGGSQGVGGDPTDNSAPSAGVVCAYLRQGSGWVPMTLLKGSNTEAGDQFGFALAIDGNTLAVGAPQEASATPHINGHEGDNSAPGAGAVYLFERSGLTWVQTAYLKPSTPGAGDAFGTAIALDGDTLLVGAPQEDSASNTVDGDAANDGAPNAGAVFVFERRAGVWTQTAYLKANNAGLQDFFGDAVAVDGDWALVGAPKEDGPVGGINGNGALNGATNAGAAYAFRRNGASWVQVAYIKAQVPDMGHAFGSSVALSGHRLAIGHPFEESAATGIDGNPFSQAATSSGAVTVYRWIEQVGQWRFDAYVKASNTHSFAEFGTAIALEGDRLVVGARSESGGSGGVDGDQAPFLQSGAGSTYVFDHDGTSWAQSHYLKAAAPTNQARFGHSIALDGGRILVGAEGEASASPGVNGDPTVGGAAASGAAYLFEASSPACGVTAYGTPGGANIAALSAPALALPGQGFAIFGTGFDGATSPVWIGVATAPASVPWLGGTLLLDRAALVPLPGSAFKTAHTLGNFNLHTTVPLALMGATIYTQAVALDAAQPFGLSLSSALAIQVCP